MNVLYRKNHHYRRQRGKKRFVLKFSRTFFKKYAVEIPQFHYIRYENIQEINELLEFLFL